MLIARTYDDILVHRFKFHGKGDHPAGMTQSPFEGADQYVIPFIQY
jgi:hypothetical protein